MIDRMSRRGFFVAVAAAFGAGLQDSTGRVYDPGRAGRALPPVTAADNDAAIQRIEKRIRCSCGCGLDVYTCRTTDFSCTYSPAMHKEVLHLAGQGKTAQQIIDEFVAQYGQQALMSPPRKGFNLAGYFVPSIVVLIAGIVLFVRLRRSTRSTDAAQPLMVQDYPTASPAELERLREELDRLSG
jgi:cytochrome c-type biogenesis protein CcmH/NrfF